MSKGNNRIPIELAKLLENTGNDSSELLNAIKFKFWSFERAQERFKKSINRMADNGYSMENGKIQESVMT